MEKSKRPSSSAFKQQRLSAWQPILTAGTVLPTFFVIGLAFIPIGIGLLISSNEVQEYQFEYTYCNPISSQRSCAEILQDNPRAECRCFLDINIEEDVKPFVYVYYGLTNFYQNHRRYVKSRDDTQLLGRPTVTNGDCAPFEKIDGAPIAPCGAIANSLFNDTFRLIYRIDHRQIEVPIRRDDISWSTDRTVKFRNPPGGNFNGTAKPPNWPKPISELPGGFQNESLIVWMRTAALPSFRKLYARVDPESTDFRGGLKPGNYTIQIDYKYPVHMFKGSKRIILSNTSWLGGRNPFLGIAYITVGSLCLALALVFFIIHKKFGKNTYTVTARAPSPVVIL